MRGPNKIWIKLKKMKKGKECNQQEKIEQIRNEYMSEKRGGIEPRKEHSRKN